MLKAVIFDFDGTLADTWPIVIGSLNELSEKLGMPKLRKGCLRDKTAKQIIKEELGLSMWQVPRYFRKAREIMQTRLERASLFPGTRDLLENLAKRYTIGILTSNKKEIVQKVLGRREARLISFIQSGSSLFGKDHALRRLLKGRGLSKKESIYVGDEVRDIRSCRKIGMPVIAVTWGADSKRILKREKPDFIIDRREEILDIVKKL